MCNACVVNSVMLWNHTRILKDIYIGPVIGLINSIQNPFTDAVKVTFPYITEYAL